jgi:ribonuclease Z
MPPIDLPAGTLLDEDDFRIAGTVLDHRIPCLAFAFEEKLRVNVWSEGLKQLKLPVGPWLKEAKRAVRRGAPDDIPIAISGELPLPLGVLKQHALRTARTKNCLRG